MMAPEPRSARDVLITVDTQTVIAATVGEVGVTIACLEKGREELIAAGEWDKTRPPARDIRSMLVKMRESLSGLQG